MRMSVRTWTCVRCGVAMPPRDKLDHLQRCVSKPGEHAMPYKEQPMPHDDLVKELEAGIIAHRLTGQPCGASLTETLRDALAELSALRERIREYEAETAEAWATVLEGRKEVAALEAQVERVRGWKDKVREDVKNEPCSNRVPHTLLGLWLPILEDILAAAIPGNKGPA